MSVENLTHPTWTEPTHCLYCGSTRLAPWLQGIRDRLDYVPGAWSFLRCERCGSGHLSPMPTPEAIPALYPPVYSFRPDFGTPSRLKRVLAAIEERVFYRLMHRGEVSAITRLTGVTSGAMLDVGCGTGDRLARFAKAGFAVRGLEIQPELVAYVRQRLGFDADVGTLETVAYPPNSFDLVTIHYVIEHLLNVRSVLAKIYSILKPNGWIVAGVPLADSCQSGFLQHRWSSYREAPRHLGIPSQEGIQIALKDCGFKDIAIRPIGTIDCAGQFALSVIPNATATHSYSNTSLGTHLPRLAAGLLTILYLPCAMVENYLLGRPACGLFLARKPG